MYVKSTTHQYRLSESDRRIINLNEYDTYFHKVYQLSYKSAEMAKEMGCILVSISSGELIQFMDDVMQGLSD